MRRRRAYRPPRAGLAGWRTLLVLLIVPVVLALGALGSSAAGAEEDNCAAAANPNVCENALPGVKPTSWQLNKVGDSTIQGFATAMSVNVGETEGFKIKTPASAYKSKSSAWAGTAATAPTWSPR